MSWELQKNGSDTDIVISGWEKGIADDPYEGIADIRSININSTTKEAQVAFASSAVTQPPALTSIAFTVAAATDRFTISDTTGFYEGMAIIINTLAGGTGLSQTAGSNTFYVTNITSTTFQVSTGIIYVSVVNITVDGSGTLSTAQFGTPADSTSSYKGSSTVVSTTLGLYTWPLILDTSGQLWFLGNGQGGTTENRLYFGGNTNHSTTTGGLGITVFKGYVFLFLGTNIDYISLSNLYGTSGANGNWHIGWQTITSASGFNHKAIAATDDAVYFCNNQTVGSILENAGSTFDPATAATYTYNTSALALPTFDFAKCLAQLGTLLLVGGIQTYIYPWDRVSTSFNYPLIVAENNIVNIVSTNSNAYVFAGNRGRVYLTNGANIQLYKKFPDQISNTENPYYTWGAAIYWRNQLYFSLSATDNAGTTISNFAGVWAYDLESDALRLETSLSYASYAGSVTTIVPAGNPVAAGNALYLCWSHSSGGIDFTLSTPYTNYEAYIDTDIIPVGTYFKPLTDKQIEYKLSKPLVSGESIRFAWRGNLTDSFITIATLTTIGRVADYATVNFQKQQWVQLRISMSSTVSSPSFDKLREIRMR